MCILLQLIPTFGAGFSAVLIFSVAIDRLMSLQKFYYVITTKHKRLYIASHVGTAATLIVAVIICSWILRKSDEVSCGIWNVMHGSFFMLYMAALSILSLLILITYVAFLLKVRKIMMDRDVKDIYRSLLVTNFVIVFGWLASGSGIILPEFFHIAVDGFILGLVIGIFENISVASNFFVYYAVSKQYRASFDHYLHISTLKSALGVTNTTRTSVVTVLE